MDCRIILGEPFQEDERWILWCFWIVTVPLSIFIIGGIVWLLRSECFLPRAGEQAEPSDPLLPARWGDCDCGLRSSALLHRRIYNTSDWKDQ